MIATGGSVIYGSRAMEHLGQGGVIVYLKLSCEENVHPAVLLTASDARFISAGPFVKLPCIIHMSASIYTAFRP